MGGRKSGIQVLCFLLGSFIILISSVTMASESDVMRTQGLINPGGDLKSGYLLINEMRIYIDQTTKLMDHHSGIIPVTEFKPKKWVYMEISKDPIQKAFKAKKIYLLPHYVNPGEKQKFPFMK